MRRTGKEVPLLLQKVLGLSQNTGTSYKAWAFEGGTLPSPKEGRRDAAAHFFAAWLSLVRARGAVIRLTSCEVQDLARRPTNNKPELRILCIAYIM